jgi:hypothetical protein
VEELVAMHQVQAEGAAVGRPGFLGGAVEALRRMRELWAGVEVVSRDLWYAEEEAEVLPGYGLGGRGELIPCAHPEMEVVPQTEAAHRPSELSGVEVVVEAQA